MLEALAEAAAWLVRVSQNFACSIVLLAGAKNVIYKRVVRPGDVLDIDVKCRRMDRGQSAFSGSGVSNGIEVVKARFELRHFSLSDKDKEMAEVDRRIVQAARQRLAILRSGLEG